MTHSGRTLILATAILALLPTASFAQDYFRTGGFTGQVGPTTTPFAASDGTFVSTIGAPSSLSPNLVENMQANVDDANFAIGPLRFSMAVGFGVEFNDNITLADEDRVSDIILRPSANVDVFWRLTDMNTLRLSLGLSYSKYIDHSEYDTDGVLISPLSELEFKFQVGNVNFTARDRFSYQQEPYSISNLSNVAQYGRYENEAGLDAEWDLNSNIRFEGGYTHYNLWSQDDIFSEQDRSIDTVYFKPSYQLFPTVRVGFRTSFSWIDFDSSDRGDGSTFFIGPFVEWQVTDFTRVYAEVGYQRLSLDGNQNQVFSRGLLDEFDSDLRDSIEAAEEDGGSSDSNSYYVRLDIENQLTTTYLQRLNFTKTAEIGFFSSYYDLYHVEYNATYTGINKLEIGPSLFFEYYETSGGFPEKATRVGAAVGARYHLTDAVTLGADYRFLRKDSDVEGADYYQNLAFLSIYYKF